MVPANTPVLALTATVTNKMKEDIILSLDMQGCNIVALSPNRPNICYIVRRQTDIPCDLKPLTDMLLHLKRNATRHVVYCSTIDTCADLFEHFLLTLKEHSYFPPDSAQLAENRLFGMYHSHTPEHNKQVIQESLLCETGTVRVIFATNALGMGVNMAGVNNIIHYGAPRPIEDYFQESGRAGRTGDQAYSTIFWKPSNCPMYEHPETVHECETNAVRHYVENSVTCRRQLLLQHFDESITEANHNPMYCCDICENSIKVT